jgi:hypothetical protein
MSLAYRLLYAVGYTPWELAGSRGARRCRRFRNFAQSDARRRL